MEQPNDAYFAYLERQGFILKQKIGGGLSGNVWRAMQPSLDNRPVAVKFCDTPTAKRDPGIRARFIREAKLLTRCQHPRIPYIITRGTIPDVNIDYIVMEYIEGENLRSLLDREGQMTPQRALEVMFPILDALAFVHRHEVTHRDVTPNNIMITADGPMLIDFSIGSDGRRSGEGPTQVDQKLGTIDYAAPEQLTDAVSVDARADVYSVAIVLYELMSTQIRFIRHSAQRILEGVPDELLDALEKATANERSQRYADANDFYHALRPFLHASPPIWQEQVPLAICQNIECWEWDGWDGGTWMPYYHNDTSARCCTGCGEPLLRFCPGCRSSLTTDNHCGNCGAKFTQAPTCDSCNDELDWTDWNKGKQQEQKLCHACRHPWPKTDTDDIPF